MYVIVLINYGGRYFCSTNINTNRIAQTHKTHSFLYRCTPYLLNLFDDVTHICNKNMPGPFIKTIKRYKLKCRIPSWVRIDSRSEERRVGKGGRYEVGRYGV